MYFNCHYTCTIGGKLLQTLISVETKDEGHNIGSECTLTVPLNARIQSQNGDYINNKYLAKGYYLTDQVKNLFKVGDEVSIQAWYDGYDKVTVFEGFIESFELGTPAKIKCLDYIYKLRTGTKTLNYKSSSLHAVVTDILKGTSVSLMPNNEDFPLQKLSLSNMSPAAMLQHLREMYFLNMSLKGSTLYVRFASADTNRIIYASNRNVLKADLQRPETTDQKVTIQADYLMKDGRKSKFTVNDQGGIVQKINLTNIPPDVKLYQKVAKAAHLDAQRSGYRGTVETLLYPDCKMYDTVEYTDIRYPERSAEYYINGIEINLSASGFHRKLRWAFLIPSEKNEVPISEIKVD